MNAPGATRESLLSRYQRWSVNPLTVLLCLLAGAALGTWNPSFSRMLSGVSTLYVELLSMIVLPFLVASVIFSLQKLFREGGAGSIAGRLTVVFLLGTAAAALLAAVGSVVLQQAGVTVTEATRDALGGIVGSNADRANLLMSMEDAGEKVQSRGVQEVLMALVPTNIFEALAQGDMLKALVFALLFGIAAGQVPSRVAESMTQSLETVYRTCQTLARWINLPLPLVLVCLAASQVGLSGWGAILAMGPFVGAFAVLSLLLLGLSFWVIARRSGQSVASVVSALREAIALAIATNNITVCMPAMIDGLGERLAFMRSRVELLVPLSASLFRAGAVVYFVCATLFVAGIYERELALQELAIVALVAWLAGFATSGMTGALTVTMAGTVCGYLNLPFEAAFLLFLAVDPLCTMLRTTLNMASSCAAVALICPPPLKLP